MNFPILTGSLLSVIFFKNIIIFYLFLLILFTLDIKIKLDKLTLVYN